MASENIFCLVAYVRHNGPSNNVLFNHPVLTAHALSILFRRRKTVPVHVVGVRVEFRAVRRADQTLSEAHGRQTVPVRSVRTVFRPVRSSGAAQETASAQELGAGAAPASGPRPGQGGRSSSAAAAAAPATAAAAPATAETAPPSSSSTTSADDDVRRRDGAGSRRARAEDRRLHGVVGERRGVGLRSGGQTNGAGVSADRSDGGTGRRHGGRSGFFAARKRAPDRRRP